MKLEEIREEIDGIDDKLVKLLSTRLRLSIKAGMTKKLAGLPIEDKKREQSIMEKVRTISQKYDIPSVFVRKIFKVIIKESKRLQSNLIQ